MPTPETLLIFTAAAMVLNLSPGPSNFYVLSRSLAQGTGAGLVAVFGLGAGSLVHVGAAALGVSAVFAYSPAAFTALKIAGALYLIYLGVRTFLAPPVVAPETGPTRAKTRRRILYESALVEILNPKTALFFLAFLPQFADPAVGPVAPQILLLGLIVSVTALPCDALVAGAAGAVARSFRQRPILSRLQAWISGSLLVGLGLALAVSEGRAER